MSSSSDQTSESSSQPSLLGGHVKYVQGAVSSALGSSTGEETKSSAVQEMRDAKSPPTSHPERPDDSEQPTQSTLLGTVEGLVGNITGCEGMVQDGAKRVPEKRGIEETSGTG